MNFPKRKKISQLIFIVYNFLVLLTMFIPSISLDKYIEYDFSDGYYHESYEAHVVPIASKIKPCWLIGNLFMEKKDFNQLKSEYKSFISELNTKLETGQISEEEFINTLANSRVYNKYIAKTLYFGGEEQLKRFQDKMFLYTCVLLVFYVIALLTLIFNILNYFYNKKLLNITNIFCGWIQVVMCLVLNVYTFALTISSKNNITGFNGGTILEEITISLSPKFIPILLIILYVAYSLYAMYIDNVENKIEKQNREIPIAVSQNFNQKTPQNKYRKINSKKSKYKHGSKKKRHR